MHLFLVLRLIRHMTRALFMQVSARSAFSFPDYSFLLVTWLGVTRKWFWGLKGSHGASYKRLAVIYEFRNWKANVLNQ